MKLFRDEVTTLNFFACFRDGNLMTDHDWIDKEKWGYVEGKLWDFIEEHTEEGYWKGDVPTSEDWVKEMYFYESSHFFDNHPQQLIIEVAKLFDAVEERDNGIEASWEVLGNKVGRFNNNADELEEYLTSKCGYVVGNTKSGGRQSQWYDIYKHPGVEEVNYALENGKRLLVAKRIDLKNGSDDHPKLYARDVSGEPRDGDEYEQVSDDPDKIIEKA